MIVNRTPYLAVLLRHLLPAVAFLLLLGGLSATPAHAQDDQEYKRAYNSGLEAAKAKNYDEAYTQFVKAADLAKKAGDNDVAERSNKVVAQIDYNRGKQLADAGNYEEALKHFEKGIARYPQYPNNLLGKGLALTKLNRTDEAMALFQEAMKSPDNKVASAAKEAVRGTFIYLASSALGRHPENPTRADAQEALSNLEKMKE